MRASSGSVEVMLLMAIALASIFRARRVVMKSAMPTPWALP